MGGVRIPDDLDPADTRLRVGLIDTLRASRQARGISQREIAGLLGVTSPAVCVLEQRAFWEARTIARYARCIGHRIEWVLHDLVVPDDDDVMAVVLAAGDTSTPDREDRVHWRTVCNDLTRIRRATCTATEMGVRLARHENTVHHWEANPDGSTVAAAQRHARALGGALGWLLHPCSLPAPLAAAVAGRRGRRPVA